MRYITSERLDVTPETAVSTTRELVDNGSGPRMTRAIVQNSLIADSTVIYRFDGQEPAPVEGVDGAADGFFLRPGETVTIDGYEAVRDLRFIAATSNASVFVTYGA